MNIKRAYSFAEELGPLKYFPSASIAAVAKIAEIIADICPEDFHARELVKEMLKRFDEWPGPATLRQVYLERFGLSFAEWKPDYSTPPPPACAACSDNGFTKNRLGRYQLCSCAASRSISEEMVRDFNNWQLNRGMPSGEIIVKRRVH